MYDYMKRVTDSVWEFASRLEVLMKHSSSWLIDYFMDGRGGKCRWGLSYKLLQLLSQLLLLYKNHGKKEIISIIEIVTIIVWR